MQRTWLMLQTVASERERQEILSASTHVSDGEARATIKTGVSVHRWEQSTCVSKLTTLSIHDSNIRVEDSSTKLEPGDAILRGLIWQEGERHHVVFCAKTAEQHPVDDEENRLFE